MPELVPDRAQGYATTYSSLAMVAATIVSGVVYVSVQWSLIHEIRDAVFVSLLIAATMILTLGMRILFAYLRQRGQQFYSFVLAAQNPEKAYEEYAVFYGAVTNTRRMTVAGLIYGGVLASVPFVLGVWHDQLTLTALLATFLFAVNFVTGIAFYGLMTFFGRSLSMGRLIEVNLFHIENPSTGFLLGATRRISILASVYISLSLASILFSELPVGGLVIMYALFALLMLLASLVVPSIPIIQRLNEARTNHIYEIDVQIDALFQQLLQEFKQGGVEHDLSRLNALLQLKERVQGIDIVPFRMKSLTAAISVLVFSAIPVILQVILTKFFGQ